MEPKILETLDIRNFGAGNGRIVLIKRRGEGGQPVRLERLRWIVFGDAHADLVSAVKQSSYLKLNKVVPGGMNSDQWQKIKAQAETEAARSQIIVDALMSHSFGYGNTRVVLIEDQATAVFEPVRIGRTNLIALSPSAMRKFQAWFNERPGGTKSILKALNDVIDGGVGGGTLNLLREAMKAETAVS